MPDTVVDITADETSVVPENTVPTPSVSTQTTPIVTTPKASDPDARIRNLMSENDKLKASINSAILEKSTLLNKIDTLTTEMTTTTSSAAEATQQAMTRAELLAKDNATLRAETARLKFLQSRPDLLPYAALVPPTEDMTKLEEVAEQIQQARAQDNEKTQAAIRTGGVVPPATPGRPTGQLSASDIDRQLKAARLAKDEKTFNALLQELSLKGAAKT